MSLFDSNSDRDVVELLEGDSSARLHRVAINQERADDLFDRLKRDVAWESRSIHVYGRDVLQPRLVAWMGDPGCTYRYSGIVLEPAPWSEPVAELRALCEQLAGKSFNSVLLNLYRDGNDRVAWHSDDEPDLGPDPVIASVSLGVERRFDLRHKSTGETIKVVLPHGSVLVMSGASQREWVHQIPRTARVKKPRINLTFRWIAGRGR